MNLNPTPDANLLDRPGRPAFASREGWETSIEKKCGDPGLLA
jgi:hypothetical protein